MIRLLGAGDTEVALHLLNQAPALNLYMAGNIEALGFGQDFCEFWGDWREGDGAAVLRAVLNRYMNGWAIYGLEDADWAGLAAVIDGHAAAAQRLQDNPGGIDSLGPYLRGYRIDQVHTEELMALDRADFSPQPAPDRIMIRRATLADLPALAEFYADAGDMTRSPAGVERPLRDTRVMVAAAGGEIVSAALTNAETAGMAMIGGVFTPAHARGRGLSQAVCSALCASLLADDKQPALYWKTPAAGAVYRKLGFHAVGEWRSVWLTAI